MKGWNAGIALSCVALMLSGCNTKALEGNYKITSITIKLPPNCDVAKGLFAQSSFKGQLGFGYLANSGDKAHFSTTNKLFTDGMSISSLQQALQPPTNYSYINISLGLGDTLALKDPVTLQFDGKTYLACKPSDNDTLIPLTFSLLNSSGGKLSSNTNLNENNTGYIGGVILSGEEASSLADKYNNHIYIYDPKHPKRISQSKLGSNNTL